MMNIKPIKCEADYDAALARVDKSNTSGKAGGI